MNDSRKLPLSLLASLVVAGALAAPASADPPKGRYGGETSRDAPQNVVKFKVKGKKVKGFSVAYVAPCNDGRSLSGTFVFDTFKRNGLRYGVKGSSTGRLGDGTPTVCSRTKRATASPPARPASSPTSRPSSSKALPGPSGPAARERPS